MTSDDRPAWLDDDPGPQEYGGPHRDHGSNRPRYNDLPWMADVPFLRDTHRRIMARRQNVFLTLKHDPALAGFVGFDEIAQRVMLRRPVPVDEESTSEVGFPRPFDAVQLSRLQRYFEKNDSLPRIGANEIRGAVEDFAHRARFNALADYVNGLKHDGVMRMHRLFEHYFSCSHDGPRTESGDSFYLVNLSIWFMTGLVRRALQPGCKNDYVVILSGKQGLRKSTGLRAIVGDRWFSENMPPMALMDRDPKRFYDAWRGAWLIEFGEGKVVRDADPDDLRDFLTRRTDKFKPAYAADDVSLPRTSVFAVTRNPEDGEGFLKDTTGNRRYWPVDVSAMVKTDLIERDREQLIAEAVTHVRFAEQYNCGDLPFYPDDVFEKTYLEPLQEDLMVRNGFDEIVAEFLDDYAKNRLKAGEIMRASGRNSASPNDRIEVGKALLRTGQWKRAESANGGYVRIKNRE